MGVRLLGLLVFGTHRMFSRGGGERSPESEWRDHIMAVVHETTLD
jgi:hypothetical protein